MEMCQSLMTRFRKRWFTSAYLTNYKEHFYSYYDDEFVKKII